MEITKEAPVTIKINDIKPKKCSLECPFMNIIGSREMPNDCYCELFHTNLKCYLSYENYRWLWSERCQQCLDTFGIPEVVKSTNNSSN